MLNFGELEGETCGRNGCSGVIALRDIDGCCSCHINPPCGYCTTPKEYCPECDWDAEEESSCYFNETRMTAIDKALSVEGLIISEMGDLNMSHTLTELSSSERAVMHVFRDGFAKWPLENDRQAVNSLVAKGLMDWCDLPETDYPRVARLTGKGKAFVG